MVQISVYTTPRVRLHFTDTRALCYTFTEELIRLSSIRPERDLPGFSHEKHLEDSVRDALKILCLPLEAELDIPGDGTMIITLDLNGLLMSASPSSLFH